MSAVVFDAVVFDRYRQLRVPFCVVAIVGDEAIGYVPPDAVPPLPHDVRDGLRIRGRSQGELFRIKLEQLAAAP